MTAILIGEKDLQKFTDELGKLSNQKAIQNVADEALKWGGALMYHYVHSSLSSVLSGNSTGELLRSLGVSPPDTDYSGKRNVKVGFDEPRKRQYQSSGKRSYYVITNAMIAEVLEYGSERRGIAPRRFMQKALSSGRNAVTELMKSKVDEGVQKYLKWAASNGRSI